MKAYHLSFDVINVKDNFDDNYEEAKRFIVCVLAQTDPISIVKYTASTFIISYIDDGNTKFSSKLFKYLKTELSKYFHYTISKISVFTDKSLALDFKSNKNLEKDFNSYFNSDISCDFKGKSIGEFKL